MLGRIIEFSVRQKYIALAMTLLIAAAGVYSLSEIPINSLPDVTPVQVLVITKAGRYSPYDVEKLVSFPIENSMNGLPGVKEVRSISQFGLSAVTIEFEEDIDIYFARQVVSQRLQSVRGELPPGVSEPNLGPISTALGEIYQYELSGGEKSLTELRTLQDWIVAPQLKTVKGVTEINSFGGFVKQYEIIVYPGKLKAYGITLQELILSLEENNSVSGGNYLDNNGEQFIIRGFGQITSIEDIKKVIITYINDRPIYVSDVAEISIGKQLRQGAVTRDGEGEVVTGIIMMLRGENSRKVIGLIEEKIAEVNKSLPKDVKISKFYDQSDLIDRTTSTIEENLVQGGLLVIVVLLLLLGEIKGAIIVATVIPLSMLFAFIGMREFGLAANLMSLGAIDFGMVVDGSVVMVENVVHRLSGHKRDSLSREELNKEIEDSAKTVARPIFFGVLIILLVYVPIATFSGMEGILYRPMAITVAAAVFGSLVFTFLYIPALSAIVFRRGVRIRSNFLMNFLKPRYKNAVNFILNKKALVITLALLVLGVSLAMLPFLGTEFLPELDEGSILVEEVRIPSITLEESVRRADKLAGYIMKNIPEVETVVPKTGRSDLANDWMGVHQTDVWVLLKPRDEWRSGMTKDKIQKEIEPFLKKEAGLAYNFSQPIAMRVDELTSGVKSDVAVKVFGESLEELRSIGEAIKKVASELKGAANVYTEQPISQPYLTIKVDRHKAASYGLNAKSVQSLIESGIGGSAVTQLFEENRRFDIIIRFPEEVRNDIYDISNLPVMLPTGGTIPLKEITDIQPQLGPREIFRENGWRRLVVSINIEDIDIGTFTQRLRKEVDNKVDVPAGYFLQYGGAFENQQRAMQHLYLVVPIVFLIITGLLYVMFGNIKYALIVLINLPFALSGGIFMLFISGLYLSVSASIGFIALFGVAVLNGIVMIAHINDIKLEHDDLREAIIIGASDRLRPVLMTALVASLGFVPMAFNVGPGSEVQRPLASVVIGGLVTSTLLTLFVLPTVYHMFEKKKQKAT